MKMFLKMIKPLVFLLVLTSLTSCAAGAATAGYSLKSQSADSLTASAEQKIVDRVKREMMSETSSAQ